MAATASLFQPLSKERIEELRSQRYADPINYAYQLLSFIVDNDMATWRHKNHTAKFHKTCDILRDQLVKGESPVIRNAALHELKHLENLENIERINHSLATIPVVVKITLSITPGNYNCGAEILSYEQMVAAMSRQLYQKITGVEPNTVNVAITIANILYPQYQFKR